LQADDICITDLKPNLSDFIQKLSNLQDAPLLGRWEGTFLQQLAVEDGQTTLFEVELWNKGRRTQSMHQYVTDERDFTAACYGMLQALHNCMSSRLAFDEDFDACVNSRLCPP